jgi:hypothetical protein
MKSKILTAALLALTVIFTGSCHKSDEGHIRVMLRDAPANYQQVNVEILKVSVHMSGGSWIDLPTNSGVYDLLLLQNGIDTTIVNTVALPAGKITQMRLLLGSNNTVMADSVIYPLTVPGGSQTGIKIVDPIIIPGNSNVTVLLDFVAFESVVEQGNGSYQLKPVVHVLP